MRAYERRSYETADLMMARLFREGSFAQGKWIAFKALFRLAI